MIYVNKIEKRIEFEIKTGYNLELLTPVTMKLLGSTKSKMTKKENGENISNFEITELLFVQYIINNNYQRNSRVLYTYIPNESFGQLLHISPKNFILLKTFNSLFSYMQVWLTDQNSNPLEIEDKINITLVFNSTRETS